jgi:hypothetical protein
MSPDYAKALRTYSTRINNKKRKTTTHEFVINMANVLLDESNSIAQVVDGMMAYITALHPDCFPLFVNVASKDKAFRLPGVVRTVVQGVESEVSLDSISCVADQGSELNVIDPVLVSLLGLPVLSLSNTGKHGLVINTANGKSTPLSLYVRLTFGAIGIWRTIKCFVRPGIKGDIVLFLGLLWLYSVKAVIYV